MVQAQEQALVRWDVIDEHLERGAATLERHEHALVAANYTLDELAERVEVQWLAHVDALLVDAGVVIEGAVAPLLREPAGVPRWRLMMAASAALRGARWDLLQAPLWSDDAAVKDAVIRACVLVGDERFDAWIVDAHRRATAPYRTVLLQLAAARGLALDSVVASLQSDDEAELAAAAAAALWSGASAHRALVEALIEHPVPAVRDAAIVTSLHWGADVALARCRVLAAAPETCTARILRLLALLGDPRDHGYVVQALAWPGLRPFAIRSLGFTGNVAAVEPLLGLIAGEEPSEARLGAEALALITGIDLDPEYEDTLVLDLPFEESDDDSEDEDDERDPELDVDDLPLLEPERTRAWWAAHAGRFDARRRHLRGQPDMPGAMLRLLAQGRMRDRADVALSLSIRTGGRARVQTDALVARQRAQLQRCAGLTGADLSVRLTGW